MAELLAEMMPPLGAGGAEPAPRWHPRQPGSGLPLAVAAYTIWGLLPLYIRLVESVPPFEFIGWRTLFTLPICGLIVLLRRQGGEVLRAIRTPRVLATLVLSACLIGGNWLIYVSAIEARQIFASSLGYYINPLVSILAARVLLGERLSRGQWLAVAIAGAGVLLLALAGLRGGGEGVVLAIAFSQALTFAGYSLVRRQVAVGALPGLTIEAMLLTVPALVILASAARAGPLHFGGDARLSLLVAFAGVVTATPLLLFTEAARRMPFAALGFTQFISPSLVFLLGLTVFHRPLDATQLACFVLIWVAIGVFCADLWRRSRAHAG